MLAGRGYNMYDRGVNCDIPRKLRHRYGANVIPLDFLVTGNEPLSELHANMFWISGRKILEAARIASERPNLHMIYLTNFKCGPDSYIKHFAREAAGAPLLILQFDGHGNDAGYMTRCEAYLDSKGILRCYQSTTDLPSAKPQQHARHSGDHPLKGKRIYIPPMAYGSARAFASAFRAIGLEAEPTPPSDHRTRELGARYTSGDECYPAKVTVGDFMKVVENPAIDKQKIALFMPTAQGPCRFGQYAPYLRQILDANGYAEVEILSPTSQNAYDGLGTLAGAFVRTGWRALLARRPVAETAADVASVRRAARRQRADVRGFAGRPLPHAGADSGRAGRAIGRRCAIAWCACRDRFRKTGSAARPRRSR